MPRPVHANHGIKPTPKPVSSKLGFKPPPPNEKRRVRCAACHKAQYDYGQGQTCLYCGVSPIPSYAYPKKSSFYPKERVN